MKFKIPVLLAAGALAASPAFALDISSTTFDAWLFISGSSAATPILEAAYADLCKGTDTDEYRSTTDATALTGTAANAEADYGASDLNYTAYTCTFKSTAPVPSTLQGKKVLVEKRSAGGSIYGVNPVATATPIANMVYSTGTGGNCVAGTTTGHNVCLESNVVTTSDGTAQDSTIPEAGISDVEPILLQNPVNNPGTFPVLTAGNLATDMTTKFPFAQGFGIAVSNDVYAQVQNLSVAQIISLLSGQTNNWHAINKNLANAAGNVNICIRAPGSGTLAGAQALFLGQGCRTTGTYTFSGTAQAFGSTGGVRGCLNNNLSIGILGLVDGPNNPPTTTDTWHFVSIDGIAPTQANFATALYPDYVESALTVRKVTPVPLTLQTTLVSTLVSELSSSSVIAALPSVSGNPNLAAAILALNPSALAATTTSYDANGNPIFSLANNGPIAWGTKSNNTCASPELNYPPQ